MAFTAILAERAGEEGIVIDAPLASALDAYFQLLRRWNRRINLTGLNLDELTPAAVDRLFIEPLIAAQYVPLGHAAIIDIGSGGGSPAIPLALASAASVTMVESRAKKSVFLREAAREAGIEATVLTARYEDLLEEETLKAAFDVLSCRALRLDRADLTRVENFVKASGALLLFRSAEGQLDEPPSFIRKYSRILPGSNSRLIVLGRGENVPRGTSHPRSLTAD